MIFRWLKRRPKQPRQLWLPFWCGNYGYECWDFVHDSTTGFYGRCRECGIVYDPVNDR